MSAIATAIIGGSLISGSMQSKASTDAAGIQAGASAYAADKQKEMFDIQNQQQAAGRGTGYQSLNQIRSMLPGQYTQYDENGKPIGTATGTDYLTHQFTAEDFAKNIDPGYQFRLQQGQKSNEAMLNKGGGFIGGNVLTGLNDYNQGMASQEYGNAFNRYQAQRTNIYNTLAGIAGLGQVAQGQTNQAGQNFANNQTALITGGAAAQAAGTVGSANAWGNAANNIGNTLAFNQLMKPTAAASTAPTFSTGNFDFNIA